MQEIAYKKTFEFEDRHWWFRARNNLVLWLVRRYGNAGRMLLLDYGCGTGKMLQELGVFGEVWGCDASDTSFEFCRQRGIERLLKPEEMPAHYGKFDVITLLDVLEHVDDDAGLLEELKKLLKPGGSAVITVPAFRWLWSGEDHVSAHKRRYIRRELESCVAKSGMSLLRIGYFNFFLMFPMFLVIVLKRLVRPSSRYESDLGEMPAVVEKALYAVFGFEVFLQRFINMPLGASLFAVVRRDA